MALLSQSALSHFPSIPPNSAAGRRFVPRCVSVPPVRHIPRFGQQLHPRPPACPPPPPPPPPHPPPGGVQPSGAEQRSRGEAPADTRPGSSATLGCVRSLQSRRQQTAQRGAANEEGAGATPVRAGLSHRCDSSQTRCSITGNTRPLEAHSHWHISKKKKKKKKRRRSCHGC